MSTVVNVTTSQTTQHIKYHCHVIIILLTHLWSLKYMSTVVNVTTSQTENSTVNKISLSCNNYIINTSLVTEIHVNCSQCNN
jgi:hypothetical protein